MFDPEKTPGSTSAAGAGSTPAERVMRIAPLDLRQPRFKTAVRGFDKNEVVAFLTEAADDYEHALRETDRLRQDLVRTEALLVEHRERETNLRNTLLTAQKLADEMKEAAQTEAKLIVREARAGKQVVRLKGGDPFIFGRGGEELDAAREAGVACEVVPGITAAAGCAAQAGLPLTHREDASAVSFVAGQCKDLTDQDWSGLAGHGRTLVIYMGLATANAIADKLIADGVSPALPVAVIERGTTADARVLRSLLADLGDLVAREEVQSPALIIVGAVAARADALDCLGAPALAAVKREFSCDF